MPLVSLSQCTIDKLVDGFSTALNGSITVDAGDGWQALFDGLGADIIAELQAQTAAITAEIQGISDQLDAGITVNANQVGDWTVSIDGEVQLSQAQLDQLVADLQGLEVTIGGQTGPLEVVINDDGGSISVSLDQATLDALENITVTIDTSAGPVEVTGSVTIDGPVTIDWNGIADALAGLNVNVDNFDDLAALLAGLEVTVNNTEFPLPDTQLQALIDVATTEGNQTQDLLLQILQKPTFVTRDVCFADGCGGYATYSIDDAGVMTPLQAYGDDGASRPIADIANCCECGEVTGCIQFEGFDVDRGLLSPGDTTTYTVNGTPVILDYNSTADGVNVSSWYDDLVNYVNSNTNFTMSVNTDVPAADNGKVIWQLDYAGPGSESLTIIHGGNNDQYTFDAAANGSVTGSVTDENGNPFSTPALVQPC